MLLALLGVAGLCYNLVGSGGWPGILLEPHSITRSRLGFYLPILAAGITVLTWLIITQSRTLRRHADVLMYLFMAVGVFFLFKLISTGSF
jgi:methyl coenzyme M reductase beta subunit